MFLPRLVGRKFYLMNRPFQSWNQLVDELAAYLPMMLLNRFTMGIEARANMFNLAFCET